MNRNSKYAYAVFSFTQSGQIYMVKGNFGEDSKKAGEWAEKHASEFPNGLFTNLIEYNTRYQYLYKLK